MVTILSPGFAPSYLDYAEGWILQRTVHAAVVAGDQPNSIVLCEHNSVYTAGTRTEAKHRPTGDIPLLTLIEAEASPGTGLVNSLGTPSSDCLTQKMLSAS